MGSARESSQLSLHVFSAVKLISLHPPKLLFTHILAQCRYNIFCQCQKFGLKNIVAFGNLRGFWGAPKLIAMYRWNPLGMVRWKRGGY